MFKRTFTVVLVAAMLASPLSAQQPAAAALSSAAPAGPSPLITLRATLRQLVTSQEQYFADHATYTADLAALNALGFRAPAKVTLTLLEAKATGWSVSASHADVAGATCVNWIGRPGDVTTPKTALEGRAGRVGEPTCDAAMAVVENQQIAEMKSALRNLVVAEEKHWADHGTYSRPSASTLPPRAPAHRSSRR